MPIAFDLPSSFIKTIHNTFGDAGRSWLHDFPTLIADCEQKFNLTVTNPLKNLSYNLVAEAIQPHQKNIIVKFCIPSSEVELEINALKLMQGPGTAHLIDADPTKGILLLEKLTPGKVLSTLKNDATAATIAAQIMQRIARPISPDHHFPSTQQWFNRLNQPVDALASTMVDRAKK